MIINAHMLMFCGHAVAVSFGCVVGSVCHCPATLGCIGQSRTLVIPINRSGSQGLANVKVAPIDQVARTTIKTGMKTKHCKADASGKMMLP